MAKVKKRKFFYIILIFLIVLSFGGAIFCIVYNPSTGDGNRPDGTQIYSPLIIKQPKYTKIQQSFKTIKTVKREVQTETKNEGICERYPTYGTSLSDVTDDEKDNILNEDALLRTSDSTYDSIDEHGNLLLNGSETGRKLYKHTSSAGMYYGDVSDTENAVVQEVTVQAKEQRNYLTGVYAPAGEVIKIEISEYDLQQIGGLVVTVGQVSHRNISNNIWKKRNDFSRMPNIGNKFTISKTVSYVGNFLGGPIYIYPNNLNVKFTVKISGAVKYPCFIYGYTTEEEVAEMKTYSAPYFDFEIWDMGVRHSGPKKYASFDYNNLLKVGDLWEKICRTSRQVPNTSNSSIGVCFVYDCFVAAGSACAFQGGHTWVNAPCNWLSGSMNYQAMTTSGFWGQIHEFNHHYQNYGIAPNGEVSNNATSLLSYVSYTNISADRSENDNNLSGWNRYTDASRGLRETLSKVNETQSSLNIYADMIHSFGVNTFIQATKLQESKTYTADAWYEALSKATGYNMTYYFENLIGQSLSDEVKAKYDTEDKNVFVPVASLYQTGRNYFKDGKEYFIETVRPYHITKGQQYILDFDKYTYLPEGFNWEIKSITNPEHGTLTKISNKKYSYFNSNAGESGTFYVVISLCKDGVKTPDVTLSVNIKTIDPKPTKTLYIYETRRYNKAEDALIANFDGFITKTVTYENTTFMNKIGNNQIGVVEGKIYVPEDGIYTICLRAGRGNHALYTSFNGVDYTKDIEFSGDSNTFDFKDIHIKKYTLIKGQYLYYKQITVSNGHSDAYTELGWTATDLAPTSISGTLLYNVVAEDYKDYDFESKALFPRIYNNETINTNSSNVSNQKIISVSQPSWDDTTKAENIVDGKSDTYYHSNRNNFVSKDNPCEILLDLGESSIYNSMKITTRSSGIKHMPVTFKLYAGEDTDNLQIIGDYSDLTYIGNTLTVKFEAYKFKIVKLVIFDTSANISGTYNKYVCILQIDFNCSFTGTEFSCDEVSYYNFSVNNVLGTFGHVISGNGYLEGVFTGERLLLNTRQNQYCKVKIEIDNQIAEIIEIDKSDMKKCGFVSNKFVQKIHKFKITVLEGILDVDSFLVV